MNKLKTGLSTLAVVAFIFLAIASNPSKKVFKNADQWIPNDFNPGKTILLVEKFDMSEKSVRNMEAYMEEKYPYKYELVSAATIKNKEGKYANTKLYKYALVISSHTHTNTNMSDIHSMPTVTGFDFNFYDRELDKNYPKTNKASSYILMTFKPVINSIVDKFE